MKLKKRVISLVISATLMMNILGVYAGTISIDEAWNQLTSSQQAKLGQVGIDQKALKKIDSISGGGDMSLFFSPPLSYENDQFVVSQQNSEQVLQLLSIVTGTEFDRDMMLGTFNDVIADINSNSTEKTRQDFSKLLGQYGMVDKNTGAQILPGGGAGGGGSALKQINIQERLEERLTALKEIQKPSKREKANLQKTIEVLSGYGQAPLMALTPESVQKAWDQSMAWQVNTGNGLTFSKAHAPVARWSLQDNPEVTLIKELWDKALPLARLELVAGSAVLNIDANTYKGGTSKVTLKPINKEGYEQAVTVTSTAKIYAPAKLGFYITSEVPQEYGVYKIDGDKEILVGGIYNEAIGAVEALVKSSGTYALKKTTPKVYKDLDEVEWAKSKINHLSQKGYIGGKSEGIYAPKDDISRAEFAVLLTRTLQLPATSINNKFSDMKAGAWYYSDVMATVEAGLFSGKSATTFDPEGKITRQEVSAVMARILTQRGYAEPAIEEVPTGVWAPGALALLKEESFTLEIKGFHDQVGKNANRAEVAYILYNLLQR